MVDLHEGGLVQGQEYLLAFHLPAQQDLVWLLDDFQHLAEVLALRLYHVSQQGDRGIAGRQPSGLGGRQPDAFLQQTPRAFRRVDAV